MRAARGGVFAAPGRPASLALMRAWRTLLLFDLAILGWFLADLLLGLEARAARGEDGLVRAAVAAAMASAIGAGVVAQRAGRPALARIALGSVAAAVMLALAAFVAFLLYAAILGPAAVR